jgi:cell division protein FtsL
MVVVAEEEEEEEIIIKILVVELVTSKGMVMAEEERWTISRIIVEEILNMTGLNRCLLVTIIIMIHVVLVTSRGLVTEAGGIIIMILVVSTRSNSMVVVERWAVSRSMTLKEVHRIIIGKIPTIEVIKETLGMMVVPNGMIMGTEITIMASHTMIEIEMT